MTDLERVARAILREASRINSPAIQDDLTPGFRLSTSRVYSLRYARAAIIELRTPSEAILKAGQECAGIGVGTSITRVWQTFIDAILSEQQP